MASFKDVNGREWQLRATAGKLTAVREATGISLASTSGEGVVAACADGEILTRVLWVLCGSQEPKLTPEQFGEAVASGEVFEAARKALHQAILDFTPPSQRPLLAQVLETEQKEQEARAKVVMEKLGGGELSDQVCHAFRVGLERRLEQILTQLQNVGDSPDSPGLIPQTRHSEK